MIRVHTDNFAPKYVNGQWTWNAVKECLQFDSRYEATREAVKEEFKMTGGYKFKTSMDQLEEMIFRQEFSRPDTTHDADVVHTDDVKNLVLYLSPPEFLNEDFLNFMNSENVYAFLKALYIYFEYFLRLVEFIIIRRDEVSGEKARIQSEESSQLKRVYSAHLSQYRLLLAREYSQIIMGIGKMHRYYHLKPIVNISMSMKDRAFHEMFLAFCTQVIWVTMHRRAYDIINMEMNRLFRSEHFKLSRQDPIKFTTSEAHMLYGKNYRRLNYRAQNSPLIQEINNVAKENLPILWIGKRKYRGTDLRLYQIELEYTLPVSQLQLAGLSLGILGHPKTIYNTLLKLDWEAVRFNNYSETYDPYRIITQPFLEVPSLNEEKLRKFCTTYESFYEMERLFEGWTRDVIKKWLRRDKVVNYFKTEGMITDVWMKCVKEVNDTTYGPNVDEIIKKFIERKEKLRKIK